ncbi:mammalian cell entry protein [Nocardioides sp. Root151]|nr:mammalian cell entry protein [Nocardioides sp. Root140]KQZ70062.1 mammalian cell entry protein [Nocardioides sp. Root151]KRF16160.1 mammalian cell entry protein [Nocardioides sp. Soil796]
MTRLLRGRILLAVVLALLVLVAGCKFDGAYDLPLPGSGVDEDKSFEVTAEFDDVLNVVPRSPVMVDDVPVGEITDVERVGWHAKVTMRIRDNVELPANAVAMIRQTSLLGEKYVALEPDPVKPPVGRLGDKDNIARADTGRNPEVEEVLGALSFLLSGGGVAQLGTITTELNNVMNGRTDRLKTLLSSLDSVVGTIDDQKADIIRAMESLNGLATTLNDERAVIGDALDVMGPAVKVLAAQHDELVQMLVGLDDLGKVGTRVIGATKGNLVASLKSLKPILSKLNEAGKSLPAGLSLMLSFPFPDEAQDIVKGDYGNTEIRLDINLENYLTDAPIVSLPDPGQLVKDLQKCLASGNLGGKDCAKFLTNLDLFRELRAACKLPANRAKDVCKIVAVLPGGGIPSLSDLTDLLGLPGLPDLPALSGIPGLPGLRDAATSPQESRAPDIYGTGLS